jgi:hypothetical protein
VRRSLEKTLEILDDNYGENRSIDEMGGYVLVITTDEDLKQVSVKDTIDLDADIFEYGLTFPVKRKKLFIVATIAEFIIEFIVIALVLMAVICLLFSSISLSLKYCTVCLVLMFIATAITKTFSFSMLSRSVYYFLLLLFIYVAIENNWFVLHFGKVLIMQLLFLGILLFCGLMKCTRKEII